MRARRLSPRLPVAALVLFALLLSACGPEPPGLDAAPDGDYAQRVYDLMVPVFWAALAVFVVVEGVLLYSVWRFRQRSDNDAIGKIHGNTRIGDHVDDRAGADSAGDRGADLPRAGGQRRSPRTR